MRRSSLFDLCDLHKSFDDYGRHDRLIDYLAQPRISLGENKGEFVKKCLKYLENRIPFDQIPQGLGYAPNDSTIFKNRFDLMATDNEAYVIAMKILPTVEELEEFSHIRPCWAILFPLKIFLVFHVRYAKKYRGFLPFGSPVKEFYNQLKIGPEIKNSASFVDHEKLAKFTNEIAMHTGCTSVFINNEMYLEGRALQQKNKS